MTVETPPSPTGLELAPVSPAERCTGCGNPLAMDQRYCLNCGKRRAGSRVDFEKYLDSEPPNTPPTVVPFAAAEPEDNRPEREVTPLMAAVGLTAVAVILILGVLIGRSGSNDTGTTAAPVIAAAGAPAAATPTSTSSTTTATVSFEADWPTGTEGFTIELATLPKDTADGTAVETAKTDLLGKGASEVGALDSDEYASLPAGNYVLYSGVFDSKAQAEAALEPLKANFPDAQVVEVSTTADTASTGGGGGGGLTGDGGGSGSDAAVQATTEDLEALAGATGEDYEEAQKKLPPTISTPGEAPPPDDKAPGGGSGGAITIG